MSYLHLSDSDITVSVTNVVSLRVSPQCCLSQHVSHRCHITVSQSQMLYGCMSVTNVISLYVSHQCFIAVCESPMLCRCMSVTSVISLCVSHKCCITVCQSPMLYHSSSVANVASLYVRPRLPPVCEAVARSFLEECKKSAKNKSLFLATSASFNAGLQYALKVSYYSKPSW